jgi:glycosyltransferase involved in cell wall biosynthesis
VSIEPKRPDVALITPYPNPQGPSASGVAWYSQRLARALADEGASVTVLAPLDDSRRSTELGSSELDGEVQVRRCFGRGPAGVMRAAGAALRCGARVTHLQHETFLFGGPEAVPGLIGGLARLRRAGTGPVVTLHQVVEPGRVDRSFTDLHRVSVPVPIARAGLSTLQGSIGRIARRTIVHETAFARIVPGSVVLPVGSPSSKPSAPPATGEGPQSPRASHGIGPDEFLVLCFGFVAPYKGLESALAAAELAGRPVHLVVAGGEHPRLQGQGYLEGLMRRFGGTATFTGYVPEDDVSGWFEAADTVLLAYPTAFSSSGVLAVALDHGVPVLLSPALAELAGLPPRASTPLEPALLAERLRSLARRGTELAELSRWSGGLAEGRSWPQVAKRHLEIYEEVTDAQRSASRRDRA